MYKTRLQMLAALGALVFADAPEGAGATGSSSAGESAPDAANGAQSDAQSSEDGNEGDEDEDTGSKADDPRLRSARDEAYQNRVKARDAEQAATTAREELEQLRSSLSKLFGNDSEQGSSEDETPDAESLTKRAAEAQEQAAQAQRQLAVFKAAGKAGGDPARLLNTVSFIRSLDALDPTDEDAITSAVTDAVKADPTLAQRRERGASTADTASGPGGGSAPKAEVSLNDALAARYGTK